MDLIAFGRQLQILRKEVGLSQQRLAESLDRHARLGATEDYRVIDSTLISRWEGARLSKGRQWKPTRPYMLYLIHLFKNHLTIESVTSWATQAGYQLTAAELQSLFPTDAPISHSIPHNIPRLLTSFIGRQEQISTITQWLADETVRLITIASEGGVGKSSLALVIAQSFVSLPFSSTLPNAAQHPAKSAVATLDFQDGVWFVPLAGLNGGSAKGVANQLATAIAKTINFSFGSVALEPSEQLINYLRPKRLLLILDNFEHLMAGTPFVLDLLQQAAQIRLLITSRVALHSQVERLFKLQGLPNIHHRGATCQ